MSADLMTVHEQPVNAETDYPSRDRFRESRRQQRVERRRRFLAVPLVLVGLGMVGAGVWKLTQNNDLPVQPAAVVNGTEVTNTTTSVTPTSDNNGDVIPTIPPVPDPSTTPTAPAATAAVTTTVAPKVSILPPVTVKRKVVKKVAPTTIAATATTAPAAP